MTSVGDLTPSITFTCCFLLMDRHTDTKFKVFAYVLHTDDQEYAQINTAFFVLKKEVKSKLFFFFFKDTQESN